MTPLFSPASTCVRVCAWSIALLSTLPAAAADSGPRPSRSALSEESIPLQTATFPERPRPIIDLPWNPFYGPGIIPRGHAMPTGMVVQPTFIVFGTARELTPWPRGCAEARAAGLHSIERIVLLRGG